MSKYLIYPDLVFTDRTLLVAALADLGYSEVEAGESLPLFGYLGDQRPETAELVIRRRSIGVASNDIGFTKTAQGYVPVISEYDQQTLHGGRFLVELRTAYAEQVVDAVTQRVHGMARRAVDGNVITITIRY